METSILVEKLEKLPADLQKEVEDFVDFLIFKREGQQKKEEIKPGFGGGKGIIGHMSDDFDEPLEEFQDYM
jgi:hypothetical protein